MTQPASTDQTAFLNPRSIRLDLACGWLSAATALRAPVVRGASSHVGCHVPFLRNGTHRRAGLRTSQLTLIRSPEPALLQELLEERTRNRRAVPYPATMPTLLHGPEPVCPSLVDNDELLVHGI